MLNCHRFTNTNDLKIRSPLFKFNHDLSRDTGLIRVKICFLANATISEHFFCQCHILDTLDKLIKLQFVSDLG